ncbi:MAG: hypothetical protein M1814_002044 [Vezdaea aestivalis]|nr:MAG: hypothetical protein M1814_002044 [Vezdaea aestivalis]
MADTHEIRDLLYKASDAGDLEFVTNFLEDQTKNGLVVSGAEERNLSVDEDDTHGWDRTPGTVFGAMLYKATVAGNATLTRTLFDFSKRHDIAESSFLNRATLGAAIRQDSPDVLMAYIKAYPDCVNFDFDKIGAMVVRAIYYAKEDHEREIPEGRIKVISVLAENGASLTEYRPTGHILPGRAIQSAMGFQDTRVVEVLLKNGSPVKQTSAIQQAAREGRIDMLEVLVKYGADVNEAIQIHPGAIERARKRKSSALDDLLKMTTQTPLHIAVEHRQLEAARWLVQHGAFSSNEDWQGRTPIDYASRDLDAAKKMREVLSEQLGSS